MFALNMNLKKFYPVFFCVLSLTVLVSACQKTNQSPDKTEPDLSNQTNQISYSLGYKIGENYRKHDAKVNPEVLYQGLKDAMDGKKSPISDDDMDRSINTFNYDLSAQKQKKQEIESQNNLSEGKKFLTENKTKKGVVTTKSGLQYEILKKGTGPRPKANSEVFVNYIGKLLNGHVIADSYKLGNLKVLHVNHVIPGWSEALKRMHVGGKWRIFVPPNLAYGPAGAGQVIPPNAVIIYDIELDSIGTHTIQ